MTTTPDSAVLPDDLDAPEHYTIVVTITPEGRSAHYPPQRLTATGNTYDLDPEWRTPIGLFWNAVDGDPAGLVIRTHLARHRDGDARPSLCQVWCSTQPSDELLFDGPACDAWVELDYQRTMDERRVLNP